VKVALSVEDPHERSVGRSVDPQPIVDVVAGRPGLEAIAVVDRDRHGVALGATHLHGGDPSGLLGRVADLGLAVHATVRHPELIEAVPRAEGDGL